MAAKTLVQTLQLGAHGSDRYAQHQSDLFVFETVRNELDDLSLASTEMAHAGFDNKPSPRARAMSKQHSVTPMWSALWTATA